MEKSNICFGIYNTFSEYNDPATATEAYKNIYKKLMPFLYENPHIECMFFFTGEQLQWFEKKHPEFLNLVEELVARKQIEILGGGFYNPLFPLLPPIDRVGQIELLTTQIRKLFGKRPRGIVLHESAWDSLLIPTLKTCGFDYVLLDSNLFDPDNDPLIIEKQGKSIFALPINTEKQYIQNLQSNIQPEKKYSFELYTENDFLKFFEHDDFTKI
ncbi:MAG: hypothetical protein ACRC5H_05825, partial [Treponemataceae bacterium]